MMEIAVGVSQKLSDYSTSVILNEELWKRVKEVYDNRAIFDLSPEDQMLLQKTYDSFALAGADLKAKTAKNTAPSAPSCRRSPRLSARTCSAN